MNMIKFIYLSFKNGVFITFYIDPIEYFKMPAKLNLGGFMAIVILLETSDGKTTELALLGKTVFGRSSKSDIQIEDSKLSGTHFSLELTKEGNVLFKDLESTNGSFLEHTKLTHHLIKIGDRIRVGSSYVYIDEKRLSMDERYRLKADRPKIQKKSMDKTLELPEVPTPPKSESKSQVSLLRSRKKENKYDKEVKVSAKDNLLEQEESSGQTKLLKLDVSKKTKK